MSAATGRAGAGRSLALYAVVYMVFLYAPVILLPLFAFNESRIVAFPITGFTTEWFELLWTTPALHRAVWNSVVVGLAAAAISTLLGVFAARAATRFEFPGRRTIVGFVMLPMVLPEILIAVALLIVLLQLGLELSLFAVTLGHVLVCTPFTTAILTSSFQGLDRSLEEASRDLGESATATFWRVTLPLVAPGLLSSLLLAFTISLDEFLISFFLTGTEPTLPVYIWGQLRFTAKLPSIMALGFLLLLASLALLLAAEYFRRRAAARVGLAPTATGGLM